MFLQSGKRQLFRQAALDRLSSPEQLDRLGPVTTPKGWLALLTFVALITGGVLWSIYGEIPTRVSGKGVLLTSGGVVNVVSVCEGPIGKLHTGPERTVGKGDVIATVSQPELLKQIELAGEKVRELELRDRQSAQFSEKDLGVQREAFSKKRENLAESIRVLRERRKWFQERAASRQQLLERGLITRQDLIDTQNRLQQAEMELKDAEHQLKQISVQEMEPANRAEQEAVRRRLEINEAKRELEGLEKRLDLNVNVFSPCDGRVLEVMAGEGDIVRAGSPILSVEPAHHAERGLEAIVYVSPADGKKIEPEMAAQVTPALVKREEYGFIQGKVRSVSQFPSTAEGMMNVLANEQLVKGLTASGAPIAVRVDLAVDPGTVSGYRWSSGEGPAIKVTSGTLCDVYITVRKQSPISLLVPMFRRATGLL